MGLHAAPGNHEAPPAQDPSPDLVKKHCELLLLHFLKSPPSTRILAAGVQRADDGGPGRRGLVEYDSVTNSGARLPGHIWCTYDGPVVSPEGLNSLRLLVLNGVAIPADDAKLWSGVFAAQIKADLAVAPTTLGSADSRTKPSAGSTAVPEQSLISYCDLVGAPSRYLGKQVRAVGVYRLGSEWVELYSTRCPEAYRTWVEWPGEAYWCADVPQARRLVKDNSEYSADQAEEYGATYGLIARGTLTGGNGVGYGHMNAYTFQFDVSCVESKELLDKRSYIVDALTLDMRRKIEEFLVRTDPAKTRPQ